MTCLNTDAHICTNEPKTITKSELMLKLRNIITVENEFAVVDPVSHLDTEECQVCGLEYKCDEIMIVEGVGPVCYNCLHNLAQHYLQ